VTTPGGTLTASRGRITYVPLSGFTGRVDFTYTVADNAGRVGNAATGTIRVS
jgi:mannan endo-1,4-beta-mannosidase